MLWLWFASQIWSDRVREKFSTAAKGQEWRCRHKWKVLRQDKGYEVRDGIRRPQQQGSSAATGVTHPQTVVPCRNRDGVCPLRLQSCQAELCCITDGTCLVCQALCQMTACVTLSVLWRWSPFPPHFQDCLSPASCTGS